ncbi:MAG TPA: NfeD family protein [Thermoleophilaceae bacterium]|jgi:membrane protein implicated in regulation of membrane protease activity
MPAWLVWLIVAAVLLGGEVATMSIFLGPLALAAGGAAVVAGVGGGVALQFIVFVVGSIAALGLLRPAVLRRLHRGPVLRTGAAALVGEPAVALARVDADGGRVKIGGEEWTARSYTEDEVIEPGTRVVVVEIRGATALVTR